MTETCGYVIARAEDGTPKEVCGHPQEDHFEHCGEDEADDYWVCESCYYWEGVGDAGVHAFVVGQSNE